MSRLNLCCHGCLQAFIAGYISSNVFWYLLHTPHQIHRSHLNNAKHKSLKFLFFNVINRVFCDQAIVISSKLIYKIPEIIIHQFKSLLHFTLFDSVSLRVPNSHLPITLMRNRDQYQKPIEMSVRFSIRGDEIAHLL